MKIAILGGTGALGGLFGVLWSEQGHEVTLIGRDPDRLLSLAAEGVNLVRADGVETRARLRVVADCREVTATALLVILVKSFDTEVALSSASHLIAGGASVLSLQNGIAHQDLMRMWIPEPQRYFGVTLQAATRIGPTRILHASVGLTQVGQDGSDPCRSIQLASALTCDSGPVVAVGNIITETWNKLCLNICTMPASVLYRLKAAELPSDPEAINLMRKLLHEAVEVGLAKGIGLDEAERWESAIAFLLRAGEGKSSMLQDFEAGRPMEIDAILGALAREGTKVGISTPATEEAIERLLKEQSTALRHRASEG